MSDLVIVLAWRRADFLMATLQRLALADEPDMYYRISIDRNYDSRVVEVADNFVVRMNGRAEIRFVPQHNFWGSSYNTFTTYADAAQEDWDIVHMIEEDILVSVDYFTYHREAHALAPDAFSVCGCRNWMRGEPPNQDEDSVYLSDNYLVSSTSYRREMLPEILKFVDPTYYENPAAYISAIFPDASMPHTKWTEQDGLLMRIRERLGLSCVYPCVPRSYHAGFSGYNRPGLNLTGTVAENAQRILTMGDEELNQRSGGFNDFASIDLDKRRAGISRIVTHNS